MAERRLSQTELANLAGVSRQTIGKLLKGRSKGVRWRTAEKLATALGLQEDALDSNAPKRAYMERIANQLEHLDFTGLGIVSVGSPMPLDTGYIPLDVRKRTEDGDRPADHGEASRLAPSAEATTLSLGNALERSQRFFLLGEPGSGKTTALRHIARAYALENQGDHSYPDRPLIPILVRLAEWAEQLRTDVNTDVVAAALAQLTMTNAPEPSNWLGEQLQKGEALLLLDGLDEVADPDTRTSLIRAVRSCVEKYPKAHVVVSSRVVGFGRPNLGATFDNYLVQPLADESIEKFVTVWCTFRHGHPADRECAECSARAERLRHAILDAPRVEALATNPMMLTILALLQEAGVALPQRRWELYQKISEAFLFSWQEKKRNALSGAPDSALTLEDREIVWILESIALEMQRHDWTLVARRWLSGHINSFLQDELRLKTDEAQAETDALVWSLHERSGILVERGPERFGFSHLALQEYFAARASLAGDDPIKDLETYFYHPRWREVIRLASTQLPPRRVPELLRRILADPDPTGRFLHRGLLVVLACLADGAPLRDSSLLDGLRPEIADLGRSRWLGVTFDAMSSLAELRSTRLYDFAEEAVGEMLRVAKEALANEDYQQFLFHRHFDEIVDFVVEQDLPRISVVTFRSRDGLFERDFVISPTSDKKQPMESLIEQLHSDESAAVRARCAVVLHRFTESAKVRKGLVQALENDEEPEVRAACASSLRHAAARNKSVRKRLISTLLSDKLPGVVRGGAARGLSRSVESDQEARALLLTIMKNESIDSGVRAACLQSLEGVLPSIPDGIDFLRRSLSGSPDDKLTRVAAQELAEYAASGRVPWPHVPIEQVEHVLTSLEHPCPHALDALRGLVDARELRKCGIPRRERIKRALTEHRQRIRLAFVFGSAARGEETPDSDIDLMVIGDASLRELTPCLRQMEHELGRPVNAAVYSEEEWRKRRRERGGFVKTVSENPKEFVVGDEDDLTALVEERVDNED